MGKCQPYGPACKGGLKLMTGKRNGFEGTYMCSQELLPSGISEKAVFPGEMEQMHPYLGW